MTPLNFKHPFTCIVSGPTKAGKTTFVHKLLKNVNSFIMPTPEKIWWFYGEDYNPIDNVIYLKGLPDLNLIKQESPRPQLVIIDDLMQEAGSNICSLFTRGCHHWNISVIHIVQNLFFKGLRTSRVNAEYLILMKNPSDRLQVQTLARQLFPNNTKYFLEAYNDATKEPFSYLLVDLTQSTPEDLRLRTDIFSKNVIVYTQKL